MTMAKMTVADRCVTNAEWRAFLSANPAVNPGWRQYGADDAPAVYVSWDDANAYCAWRTALGDPCRLPTDAEWAAGLPSAEWTVGREIARNGAAVWEWTADAADHEPARRVVRGGSRDLVQDLARAAFRRRGVPDVRDHSVGVRVVRVGRGSSPIETLSADSRVAAAEAGEG